MGIDLSTQIGKIKLKNPVLVASGTFGHAKEFENFFDLKKLGGIVTKTITIKPRLGNPPPRIVETPSGMLNAIGLQNPGVEKFIEEKLPFLRKTDVPIIVSVMAYGVDEFVELVQILEKEDGIDWFEMNLSCPNVSYGTHGFSAGNVVAGPAAARAQKPHDANMRFLGAHASRHPQSSDEKITTYAPKMFAHDAGMIKDVVSAVRKVTSRTVIAKLGPDVSNIGEMAMAAEKAGADAIALTNTFMAMKIDIHTRKPVLANKTGGLSGPCIRPIAVRLVWEAARQITIPVVGIGGIMSGEDAIEFMMAGASAVQVGTANFINPRASMDVLGGIKDFMKENKISALSQIIRSVKE